MENAPQTPPNNLPQQPQQVAQPPLQPPTLSQGGNKSKSRMIIIIIVALLVIGFVIALVHHSAKAPSGASSAHSATVQITAQGFEPATLKVKVGTTVTWNNTDSSLHQVASNPYPANNGLRGFVSKGTESGQSYSYKFTRTGDFGYHDQQNPTKLLGQVDVSN
jgi:plastocyanin